MMFKSVVKKILKTTGVYPFAHRIYVNYLYRGAVGTGTSSDYWEAHYGGDGTSGEGSYGILAEFKAEIINEFLKSKNIHSVVEWGCGDGNQLSFMNYNEYLGLDVSSTAIGLCSRKFIGDDTKRFLVIDNDLHLNKQYDLAVSLDVIYHLLEDSIFERYMNNLFSSSCKYVCIYSSNFDSKQVAHERDRKFTVYVEENYPDFNLIHCVKNRYPYDENNPYNTSKADFYFYCKAEA